MRVLQIRRKHILVYLQIYCHLSKRDESRGAICSHPESSIVYLLNQKCSPSSKDVNPLPTFLWSCFSSRIKVKEEEKAFFFTSHFFSEEPNTNFLACVSMVIVPRTVWRCSKFGAWNYQEGSVASATPSCQSFTINRSLSCVLWRRPRLEWIRVFEGEPQCISPYARTESINTSRPQKQTRWCNCLALRLSLSFQMKAPQPFSDSKSSQKKKEKLKTRRLRGEEIHLTQCIVTL